MTSKNTLNVAVVMGSLSDHDVMKPAVNVLKRAGIDVHVEVLSAHRTPDAMRDFAMSARQNGFSAIVAGAGGAAHLPGMIASWTDLLVIGVPVATKHLGGQDSLLSIVQMPKGVPVATVGINQGENAGLTAIRALSTTNKDLAQFLKSYDAELKAHVADMNEKITS